jgi:hypothetical protein
MNRRRQLLSAIGLGSLFAGVTAAVPREALAATEKSRPTFRSTPPLQRPEYKVFSVPAGDHVEDAFNAVAREGFQYAGSSQRYGDAVGTAVACACVARGDQVAAARFATARFLSDQYGLYAGFCGGPHARQA